MTIYRKIDYFSEVTKGFEPGSEKDEFHFLSIKKKWT